MAGLALGAVGAPSLALGARGDGPGDLPWRVGGRVGFTVDAATFPDSAGYALELYLRIPPATLSSLTRDDSTGVGRLKLHVRLRNAYGSGRREAVEEITIAPGDTSDGFGKVVMLRFPTRPGRQRLFVRLEDPQSRRPGLLSQMRKAVWSGQVEGEFEAPEPQEGRDLSNLEFEWRESPASDGPFLRAGRTRLPNPERLYGLFCSDLRLSFSARAPEGDLRPWETATRLFDAAGRVVAQHDSIYAAGQRLEGGEVFDVSTLPAGGYDAQVKAWQQGDSGAVLRRAHFSIAWRRQTWEHSPRDVEDTVHFLLSADEEDAFAGLQPGEQERYMEDFWRVRDPTPETAENEARELYLKRVDFANRTYGRFGLGKGMFSDMGRVFIRYGEPSEVLRQVIPTGDETLERVVDQLAAQEQRPLDQVRQQQLGGDMRPYEVWIYDGDIPPPPDADPSVRDRVRHRRLVFLFVDEQGLGDYRLRYSSE